MADRGGGLSGAAPTLADALVALPVAVLLVDAAGRVAHANAACEQLLDRSERALLGRHLDELLVLPATAHGHDVAAFDTEIVVRDRPLRVDLAATALPDHPGWRAVTLHRRASASGDRNAAGRSAVGAAAMLAHEIKNPLAGIRGAAQLIASGAEPTELTVLITAEVDRVAALIDRMEDFTDDRPLPLQPLNLYPLLLHAREVAQAGFAHGAVIEERFDPSLPAALGNADALLQIVLNLLLNADAALAGHAAPRITLTTAYRHGTALTPAPGRPRVALPIELCVIDNGPGAPSDIAGSLFEPFVSGRREGKGLGLALVDKLVRDIGGTVQYAREGHATVFRLLLQRAAA